MYLWVVLITFIAMLYSYNLSVRGDERQLSIEPMAEAEVIRMSNAEGKPATTFNGAFGGFGEPRKRLQKLIKDYLSKNKIKIACFSGKELKAFYLTYNYGYIELVETSDCEYENYQLYSFNDLSKKFGDSKINFGMSNNIKLSLSEKNISLF